MAEILLSRLTGPSGFERPVVVKRILPHLAHSPEFSAMFLDEARLVARIRHPNVVQVHELGEAEGELFLVMEYLEGESVAGILRRFVAKGERVPYTLGAYAIAEACAGLHAAHESTDSEGLPLDLVHRDVSPQNVFVLYGGGVRLLDFGIAKASDRSSQTAAGELKGKFQYMSPEQCLCKPLDRRSDLFSLGVVLFELTTNRRLFKRDNELLTFKAICELPVPRPSQTIDDYPEVLEKVVLKALARRVDERYQTAAEMRRDLLAAAREMGAVDEPAEALSRLMHSAFQDRIDEKSEMLRRVGSGSSPTHIPENDADASVDVPDITEWVSSKRVSRSAEVSEAPPARRRTGRVLAVPVTLLAVGATAYFALGGLPASPMTTGELTERTPTAPGAIASPPPRVSAKPPTTKQPPQVAKIVLSIASRPSGAAVFLDGEKRGNTPLSFDVMRSETARILKVEQPGFEPVEKSVVPDQARSFDLALLPVARKSPRRERKPDEPKPPDDVPLF
jgi:serine/threonine-protein kinase